MSKPIIRIGSRRSPLALAQSQAVADSLAALGHSTEIVTMDTRGDQILDRALHLIGGDKGLFTMELEQALITGDIDIAVHSYKDLPATPHPELPIIATPEREKACDYLILSEHMPDNIIDIPSLSTYLDSHIMLVGTSSLRRISQLRCFFGERIEICHLRGNIQTRLSRLGTQMHSILLAAAGLHRLSISEAYRVLELPIRSHIPAPTQGILAIQGHIRVYDDALLMEAFTAIMHEQTYQIATLEKLTMAIYETGCQSPFGAWIEQSTMTTYTLHIYEERAGQSHISQLTLPIGDVRDSDYISHVRDLISQHRG